MEYFIGFILGLVIGVLIAFFIYRINRGQSVETFSTLSLQALSQNSAEFLKLANETLTKQTLSGANELEGKKKLIDQTLEEMKTNFKGVEKLVVKYSEERHKQFGEVSTQLKATAEQTNRLHITTNNLNTALASSRIRGQWGERMVEDVLRIAGLIEHVNYEKQKQSETTTSRPDFTFFLPQNLKVNMDVKFPLENYIKYVNEESDSEKSKFKDQFLRDVKSRIKEVTTRDYINPEDNTVDYVLVFIPNEQVYCFINENDRELLDEALKMKVVVCSPLTLYAILVVIRQAVENFKFEETASKMLGLFSVFNKQWNLYKTSMDRMGRRIQDANKEYETLVSTRTTQLERPLARIQQLKIEKGLDETEVESELLLSENLNLGMDEEETIEEG
ncbi:DNA recombination protein RmuC [Chloroflexota bacterium]